MSRSFYYKLGDQAFTRFRASEFDRRQSVPTVQIIDDDHSL